MPDLSTRLGLSLPLANETFSRTAYRNNLEDIDQKVASLTDLDQLAGTGRTTETVKGNTDAHTAHLVDGAAHGAVATATANTIIRRDASGRAKVAAPSEADDIARKDTVDSHANAAAPHSGHETHAGAQAKADAVQTNLTTHLADITAHDILQKFGATATSGVTDWNDITNTKPGTSPTLLMGNAANGPSPGNYFHCFNLEYSSKDGSGNITQLAIPYGGTGIAINDLYIRGRYNNAWSSWKRVWTENNIRINGGQLEFYDGGAWKPVSGGKMYAYSSNLKHTLAASGISINVNSCKLAGKFIPLYNGIIHVEAELMTNDSNYQANLHLTQLANIGYIVDGNSLVHQSVGFVTTNSPLGSEILYRSASTSATGYTNQLFPPVKVFAGIPVLFWIVNPGDGRIAYVRNIKIYYDELTAVNAQ